MLNVDAQTPQKPAPLPVDQLCRGLERVALTLALPGRSRSSVASATTHSSSGGEEKTPTPAPNAELMQMALAELPNAYGGPFDSRDDWVAVAHAVKGASLAGGIETQGRELFVEWSQQWGGDAAEAEQVWDGIANPHVGWGWLMRTLRAVNTSGATRVKAAEARAAFSQEAASNRAAILGSAFTPVAQFVPAQIPPRRWLYGRTVIAGLISFLVAPGGSGKSALVMTEAVAMACGRELLEGEQPVRPLRVWFHNAEDDLTEMQRRLAATLLHFGLPHSDLNDNLFLTSGRDFKLTLARTGRDGPEIVPGVVDGLVERLIAEKIDVLILDPLGALHTLPENSNDAANRLLDALREIAHRAQVAVIILHHAGKAAAMDMDTAGAGAARGASAFVDAARSVRQLVRMTAKEAARYGIADVDRRDFLRVENGKANLARAADARWIRLADVALGNGAGLWPLGDRVGVAERWTAPTAQPGTSADLARVQAALNASPDLARADHRSPDWVGWLVAQALAIDAGRGIEARTRSAAQAENFVRVRALVDGWLHDGGLVVATQRDAASRKDVKVVRTGTPAILAGTDAASAEEKENAE